MLKSIGMMVAGFILGILLTENAQIIRHSVPKSDNLSGNIYQFIFILGVGNSSNTFEVNTGLDTETEEHDEQRL